MLMGNYLAANGIPVEGWIADPSDEALLDLLPMLDSLRFTSDVRHVLGLRLATSTAAFAPARPSRLRKSSSVSNAASEGQDHQRTLKA